MLELARVYGISNPPANITVDWDDAWPSNATDCAAASLWCYSWQGSTPQRDVVEHGTWSNNSCKIPSIRMDPLNQGVQRRYAISARINNTVRYVSLAATPCPSSGSGGFGGLSGFCLSPGAGGSMGGAAGLRL